MPNNKIQSLTVEGVTYDIVDNTSGYITADSPTLTGTPTAPTPLSGASDTQIATVKYVQDSMAGVGTGTVTNVGVANATNGGLSVSGSPITGSGTISVGHSNVLTSAQTTSGIYPIKIDKNGHISEYGSAVSIPTKVSDLTNDSGFITSYTDEKLKVADIISTTNTTYYPIVSTLTSDAETKLKSENLKFTIYNASLCWLSIGNGGTSRGKLRLYTTTSGGYTTLQSNATTSRDVNLPDKDGTIALTSDIPSISLNGSSTTSALFYAPTDAGTSGQVLTSNGSGVPTWATIPAGITVTLNGSTTTTPSFYAPTTAGTDGYVLKSNGSGAPTWTSAVLTDEKLSVAEVTSGSTYYPIVGSGTTAATRQYDTTGFIYVVKTGTSSANGWSSLILGNNKTSGTAGNKQGYLTLYGANGQTSTLKSGAINNNSEIALPDSSGTLALQEDMIPIGSIPSTYMNILLTTNTADTKNKYYDAQSGLQYYSSYSTGGSQGYAGLVLGNNIANGTAYNARGVIYLYGDSTYSTSISAPDATAARQITLPNKSGTVALTSDIPTVPTITLNGSSTTSPSFYAPTSAGTSGQVLTSNGSGAPMWAAAQSSSSTQIIRWTES